MNIINNNDYFIDEPAVISFSGGRSSAYMLYKVLEAHNWVLPEYVKVIFANTGKEMPQTLDFVKRCSEEWSVEIVWVERFMRLGDVEENKYMYDLKVVDYDSASRNGEPFESLAERNYLPNPVARFCTKELKVEAINEYMMSTGYAKNEYLSILGIRADEQRRARKLLNANNSPSVSERFLPMHKAKVTKEDISEFWKTMPFDLELPNNNGTTDWGNCDLCFLKGARKRMSIISENPNLADWWIAMEKNVTQRTGKRSTFVKNIPNYAEMKIIATSQIDIFEDDPSIDCFCGD